MPRIDVDPRLAERLIDGRASGAELPRGAAGASRVLEAARRAATERDDAAMTSTVAAMRAVLAPNAGQERAPGSLRRFASPLPRLLTACVAGLTVLFGGLAAAGALPAGAQKPVADLVSHVGIDLPQPSAGDKTTPKSAETTTTTSTTSTTVATADTTPTTAPTTETTVPGPVCAAPAYEGPNGCVTPVPVPTTVPPPTTTTTVAPHPTTTVPAPTTTTVASGGAHPRIDG